MRIADFRVYLSNVVLSVALVVMPVTVLAGAVADETLVQQRRVLAENTVGKGFGPQAPRDIDNRYGKNTRDFGRAPAASAMNLCNIHFHKNAEHKGGEFTRLSSSGYQYSGELSKSERQSKIAVCKGVMAGDTIEVHYVYSSADVKPGPTLGACLNDSIKNPQLRVEAQVYVLVTDSGAGDFVALAAHDTVDGLHQALNIPTDTGEPVQYAGSTTGPAYNKKASPLQVSWRVRPKVAKLDISSLGRWCGNNVFNEDHAHGVRNLVVNPALLSTIK